MTTLRDKTATIVEEIEEFLEACFHRHATENELPVEVFATAVFYACMPIVIASGWSREMIIGELDQIVDILGSVGKPAS